MYHGADTMLHRREPAAPKKRMRGGIETGMPDRGNPAGTYLDYALALASERVRRDLLAATARHGVPLEIWHVLALLQDGRGRAMGEVAQAALLSLPTATRIVDRMVSDSLVYRAPDPADRRKVLVLIADRGRVLWRKVKRDADRHQNAMADRFGDEWLRDLIGKLDHLAAAPDSD